MAPEPVTAVVSMYVVGAGAGAGVDAPLEEVVPLPPPLQPARSSVATNVAAAKRKRVIFIVVFPVAQTFSNAALHPYRLSLSMELRNSPTTLKPKQHAQSHSFP